MTGNRLFGITGKVHIRLTGACPEDCLGYMTRRGVRFQGYQKTDPLTAELTVSWGDLETVRWAAKRSMCQLDILDIHGLLPGLRAMKKRVAYLGVLVGIVLLVFLLQNHIFFLEVQGNTTIPEERILQILEENGVGFWTSTKELDLNTLKNQVLSQIPELGFLTINTEGPMATVVVRQREEKPVAKTEYAPANVVASQGGVIQEVTVTGGTAQVKKGDVVYPGQLLISGVTNLDKTILVSRAEGEVTARTFHQKQALLGDTILRKQYTGEEKHLLSLSFGKKTINFYKTSGISYDNYDKMEWNKALTLPGGYTLPLCLRVTTLREYDLVEEPVEEDRAEEILRDALRRDTQAHLKAGMILDSRTELQQEGDFYRLSGVVECREDIGVSVEIKD